MLLLLCVAALPTTILMVRCTNGSSQAGQEGQAPHSDAVKLALLPEHNSGVSGTVSLENTSGRVLVKLDLRGLPSSNTYYLAHIQPGTCAQEAGETHGEHGGRHKKQGEGHDHGEEIEYPLSQVKSDAEGHGSSTTTLLETSVKRLLSGEPKHVNVHEAGSGNPPILSCADLKRAVG